jgi:hypothetical protein
VRSGIDCIDLRILDSVGRKSPIYISVFRLLCLPRASPLTDKATYRVGSLSRHTHKAVIPTEVGVGVGVLNKSRFLSPAFNAMIVQTARR